MASRPPAWLARSWSAAGSAMDGSFVEPLPQARGDVGGSTIGPSEAGGCRIPLSIYTQVAVPERTRGYSCYSATSSPATDSDLSMARSTKSMSLSTSISAPPSRVILNW